MSETAWAWSPAIARSIPMPRSKWSSPRYCSIGCCIRRRSISADVGAVVMDEFHNFNEPQRGIVWELSLSLLPKTYPRDAPVGDGGGGVGIRQLDGSQPRSPRDAGRGNRAARFRCIFNGSAMNCCPTIWSGSPAAKERNAARRRWSFVSTAKSAGAPPRCLRGKDLFAEGQRQPLLDRLESFDFSDRLGQQAAHISGARHRHPPRRAAAALPPGGGNLFQEKLLPVLRLHGDTGGGDQSAGPIGAAHHTGKGPRDKKKLIDAGAAQQMFGRAGRPQYDTEGHVFALAHEDDVKLARWKIKYDSIPEDTKDPGLMKAKKALAKKKPTRRGRLHLLERRAVRQAANRSARQAGQQGQSHLALAGISAGRQPAVEPIRQVIRQRLMASPTIEAELKRLTKMLVTLSYMGVVMLDPPPPPSWEQAIKPADAGQCLPEAEEDDEGEDPAELPDDTAPPVHVKRPDGRRVDAPA